MDNYELRDPDHARQYLLQGLWLARAVAPSPPSVTLAVDWAYEVAAAGMPVPPLGFLADVGTLSGAGPRDDSMIEPDSTAIHVDAGLDREYEDYVLGKLYADLSFERAADALMRYQDRDRLRGGAFLIGRICERAGIAGAVLSPSVVKLVQNQAADKMLAESWESIRRDGWLPHLLDNYKNLITAVRNTGDLLGSEDVFELEHGTALAEFGQRLALRQVLQAADAMEQRWPRQKPRPRVRHHQVATRIMDEDMYPVGGFASLSNRGSLESLLHVQLAFMERDERPDLFDVKYLQGELLYYSRDENQFLRRRQTFVFALYPDLVRARFKDAVLPFQRIVLVLGCLLATTRKLTQWLSDSALQFEFLLVDKADGRLQPEKSLLEMLFREQLANGTAHIQSIPSPGLVLHCQSRARRSLCHLLLVSAEPVEIEVDYPLVSSLQVNSTHPTIKLDEESGPPAQEKNLPAWMPGRLDFGRWSNGG